MGIDEPIALGGHFPIQDPKDDMSMEELVQFESNHWKNSNHVSLSERNLAGYHEGVDLVCLHLEQGCWFAV